MTVYAYLLLKKWTSGCQMNDNTEYCQKYVFIKLLRPIKCI